MPEGYPKTGQVKLLSTACFQVLTLGAGMSTFVLKLLSLAQIDLAGPSPCICVVVLSFDLGSLWLLDRVGPQPRRSVRGRMGLLGSRG